MALYALDAKWLMCAFSAALSLALTSVAAKEESVELGFAASMTLPWPEPTFADQRVPQTWTLLGQHEFTYWGLAIYKASLWSAVKPSGVARDASAIVQSSPPWGLPTAWVALSLVYQRGFTKELLVKRSLQEMLAQHTLAKGHESDWEKELMALLPNVNAQDELLAVYESQDWGRMWLFGKTKGHLSYEFLGVLKDAQLAQSFMGIWLSSQSTQPKMREALLGRAPGKLQASD